MLCHWLDRPHVVEWWGGERPTLEAVRESDLPRVRGCESVTAHVALLGDDPFSFAQAYVAKGSGEVWWEDETDPGVHGVDQTSETRSSWAEVPAQDWRARRQRVSPTILPSPRFRSIRQR